MARHIHVHMHDAPTRDSWEESKHPRKDDGKFGSGSGGSKVGGHKESKAAWQKRQASAEAALKADTKKYPADKVAAMYRQGYDYSDIKEKLDKASGHVPGKFGADFWNKGRGNAHE